MNHVITTSVADIFSRPADNNYDSIEELLNVAHEEMNKSRILKVQGSDIRFSATSEGFKTIYLDVITHSPIGVIPINMKSKKKKINYYDVKGRLKNPHLIKTKYIKLSLK